MDKHSRAFGRPGKGKRRRLSTPKRKPRSEKQDTPDELVELATDAIRDGQTTVAMFLAPFHPDLRFRAFRAYTAAVSAFMAKWRREFSSEWQSDNLLFEFAFGHEPSHCLGNCLLDSLTSSICDSAEGSQHFLIEVVDRPIADRFLIVLPSL
jgi:hypothetical protein